MNPGLDTLLGIETVEMTAERVELAWTIRPELLQPYGIVHGGVYCSVVESAASMGAATWFGDRGTVVGVSNQTDFFKSMGEGRLTAVALPIHRGRSQQVWQVVITDTEQRTIARGQVRVQNLTNHA
jgi:1,4-dihydroxy-2-naphthoyl-CoA hydrolase